jgi:hypothetical protein
MTEAIKEARDEAIAFKPIQKTPEEKTSYKVNQKLLLISLCAMALIGSTYYWMDDRTDVWEISWLFGSLIWYAAIIFAISFVKQKASYFRSLQPFYHHSKVPQKHIYSYSFALYPEKHQPSGFCDFTKFNIPVSLSFDYHSINTHFKTNSSITSCAL